MKRKKTSIIKKDDNPQYQESFNFRIEEDEFDQSGLRVTCMQQQPILEKGKALEKVVLEKDSLGNRSQNRQSLGWT